MKKTVFFKRTLALVLSLVLCLGLLPVLSLATAPADSVVEFDDVWANKYGVDKGKNATKNPFTIFADEKVSISYDKKSSYNVFYPTSGGHIRLYNTGVLTFTSSTDMTSIVITCTDVGNLGTAIPGAKVDGTTVTYAPGTPFKSLTTADSGVGKPRISKITITYADAGGAAIAPLPTASDAEIVEALAAWTTGKMGDSEYTLTGTVGIFDSTENAAELTVEGQALWCYNMTAAAGVDLSKIKEGSTILVKGFLYNDGNDMGFTNGCTVEFVKPETPADILAAVGTLTDSATPLPLGPYTLSGKVTEVSDIHADGLTRNVFFQVEGETVESYYQASSDTIDVANIQVGDTVEIQGELYNYNGTKEFKDGILLSLTYGPSHSFTDPDPITPDAPEGGNTFEKVTGDVSSLTDGKYILVAVDDAGVGHALTGRISDHSCFATTVTISNGKITPEDQDVVMDLTFGTGSDGKKNVAIKLNNGSYLYLTAATGKKFAEQEGEIFGFDVADVSGSTGKFYLHKASTAGSYVGFNPDIQNEYKFRAYANTNTGTTEFELYKQAATTEKKITHSLVVGGDLKITFNLSAYKDTLDAASITAKVGDRTVDVDYANYTATVAFAAKEVGEEITLSFNEIGSDTPVIDTYSVTEYQTDFTAKYGDTQPKATQLLNDTLIYGQAASAYFNGTQAPSVERYNADMLLQIVDRANVREPYAGIHHTGSTLVLEENVRIRHYFKIDEGTTATFMVNGTEVTPTAKGDEVYIEIPGVSPGNWDKAQIVTVNGVEVSTHSVMSLTKKAIGTGAMSEELIQAMIALWFDVRYYTAA